MTVNHSLFNKLTGYAQSFTHNFDTLNELISPDDFTHLVVFSHLRWEFVKQRPQHLMERFSKKVRIVFVEEPIGYTHENRGTAYSFSPTPQIEVIQPRIAVDTMHDELVLLMKQYFRENDITNPVLWFYTGAFSPVIPHLPSAAIVYDCMDELSAFRGASPILRAQEHNLLKYADVVFTGGKSLYESKRHLHPRVHCFPSSVDKSHFSKSIKRHTKIPDDLASIPQPRVGFYGVIDERIDLALVAQAAEKCPHVSFVMIGPVVKIKEADLPRYNNIYYLGPKQYEELPSYLKGFDIAWMPFSLNESTQFISPTKTLEFMAAYKPIISTAVYDVVRDYSSVVRIVKNSHDLRLAVERYLHESQEERAIRLNMQKDICTRTSWDTTTQSMKQIIARIINNKAVRAQLANNLNSRPAVKGSPISIAYE